MIRIILSILLLIISIKLLSTTQTTDPEILIERFIQSVSTSAIQTNFTFIITEKKDVPSQRHSGRLLLHNNQFYLEMNEVLVWFNGKTQWALLRHSNEVTITEPTKEEIAEINPVSILSNIKTKSSIRSGRSTRANHRLIELLPNNKYETYTKVEVEFANATGHLSALRIFNTNGGTQEITLTNYQTNVVVQPNTFNFDRAKFPNAIINDMR